MNAIVVVVGCIFLVAVLVAILFLLWCACITAGMTDEMMDSISPEKEKEQN